jgi:hypothetical protein
MAQATDVVLDGAGYMLAPIQQAYRRGQDGIAEGRSGRVQIRDFYGGQLRPFQLERDRAFRGESVGPAYGGQGVRPWAVESTGTLPGTVTASLAARTAATVVGDYVYFTNGNERLMRITNAIGSGTFGGVQVCRTHSVAITGLTPYGEQILYGLGAVGDLQVTTDYPACATTTPLAAGERGWGVAGWSGSAIWASAKASDRVSTIAMVHGLGIEKRYLDTKVLTLAIADGAVWAVTRTGLHRYTGRITDVMIPNPGWTSINDQPTSIPGKEWSGEWEFVFQHGLYAADSDHRFLVGYGGRLYTNVGGFIGEYRPDGGRAGWRDTGLHYVSCTGAAVCGGYLVVTITTERGTSEICQWE